MSNHIAVTDLMNEADSYRSFWIEERDKRILLEKTNAALVKALEALTGAINKHGNWDDGCFYYGATSASELQEPLKQANAALVAAKGET